MGGRAVEGTGLENRQGQSPSWVRIPPHPPLQGVIIMIKIKKYPNLGTIDLPDYATSGSAGMDLAAAINCDIIIQPGEVTKVATGIAIALPEDFEAQIRPRSGLAIKHKVTVLNAPGTIDSDYRGEIIVLLINHSQVPFIVTRGMRIAQMVINKVEKITWQEVKDLETTTRGEGGFGSTGFSQDEMVAKLSKG